jgi:hypothetical protein
MCSEQINFSEPQEFRSEKKSFLGTDFFKEIKRHFGDSKAFFPQIQQSCIRLSTYQF